MDNYSLSVGVIVIKDSKVLLVKHNYGSANGKYLNPGGFLKDGELPEEAAVREVFEETGVKISPVGMIAVRCRSNESRASLVQIQRRMMKLFLWI